MLNQIVIVGRIVTLPQTNTLTIACTRSYKNSEGLYDTDFIDCILSSNTLSNALNYLNKGDIVGVKGRLETRIVETDNTNHKVTEVICEKLTFLSSHKQKNDNDNIMNKGEI